MTPQPLKPMPARSRRTRSLEPCLRATHNTTADGIRFIEEMGGLPNPSLAIHRSDHPFDTMGDISLVAPLCMVDPSHSDVEVYDADIYSVRTPERYFETTKATKALVAELEAEAMRLQGGSRSVSGIDAIEKGEDPPRAASGVSFSVAAQSLFLRSHGIEVGPVFGPPKYRSPGFETAEVQEFFERLERPWYEIHYDAPEYRRYSEAVRSGLLRLYTPVLGEESALDIVQQYFGENGLVHYGRTSQVSVDLEAKAAGQVLDSASTRDHIESQIEALGGREAVEAYFVSRIRATYGASFFRDKRERKIPFTMENLSQEMARLADPRARETTLTYGPGNARGAFARKLKSLDEVGEYMERMVTKEGIQALKEAQEQGRSPVVAALTPYHPWIESHSEAGATWETLDDMHRAIGLLGKATSLGESEAASALRRVGFRSVPPTVVKMFLEYARLIAEAPTQYLEVKMKRPVALAEFAAAIVPDDTPVDVLSILEAHGLAVASYPRRDAAARAAAFDHLCSTDPFGLEDRGVRFVPAKGDEVEQAVKPRARVRQTRSA